MSGKKQKEIPGFVYDEATKRYYLKTDAQNDKVNVAEKQPRSKKKKRNNNKYFAEIKLKQKIHTRTNGLFQQRMLNKGLYKVSRMKLLKASFANNMKFIDQSYRKDSKLTPGFNESGTRLLLRNKFGLLRLYTENLTSLQNLAGTRFTEKGLDSPCWIYEKTFGVLGEENQFKLFAEVFELTFCKNISVAKEFEKTFGANFLVVDGKLILPPVAKENLMIVDMTTEQQIHQQFKKINSDTMHMIQCKNSNVIINGYRNKPLMLFDLRSSKVQKLSKENRCCNFLAMHSENKFIVNSYKSNDKVTFNSKVELRDTRKFNEPLLIYKEHAKHERFLHDVVSYSNNLITLVCLETNEMKIKDASSGVELKSNDLLGFKPNPGKTVNLSSHFSYKNNKIIIEQTDNYFLYI